MKKLIMAGKIGFVGLVALVAVISGKFIHLAQTSPLLFMLIGLAGLMLMGFPFSTIKTACRTALNPEPAESYLITSRYFWEAQARNALLLGILGTIMSYEVMLSNLSASGGFSAYFPGLSKSFIYLLYGVMLAIIFAIPALKINKKIHPSTDSLLSAKATDTTADKPFRLEYAIGYVLFIIPLIWMLTATTGGKIPFLHWPGFLVVFGGTIAISLFIGNSQSGQSISFGFAATGLIGGLMGVIQLFHALGDTMVRSVAEALAFSLTSCVLALLGIMLLGGAIQDHTSQKGNLSKTLFLNRLAWYVFPLIALLFLCLTIIIVIMPVKQ